MEAAAVDTAGALADMAAPADTAAGASVDTAVALVDTAAAPEPAAVPAQLVAANPFHKRDRT